MDVKKITDYQKKVYNYPSENIDPKLKQDKRWFIKQMEAMTHLYVNNQCSIPFRMDQTANPDYVSIDTLRAYAKGTQGSRMVKAKLLNETAPGSGKFKTKMKNVFQTYDVLPEMFDVIRAYNQRQEYEMDANGVDDRSIRDKDLDKAMLKFLIRDETKELMQRAGYKPNTSFSPEELAALTAADIDTIFESGGYLLQKELAALACCEETKEASGHKEIENMINDDIIIIGKAGVKTYVDRATQTIKYRYVEPKRAFLPHSVYEDYRDITRCGEYRKITIAELREINPDLTGRQIEELIEGYKYINPNYEAFASASGQYLEPEFWEGIESCVVWVFDAQWLSADYKTTLKFKHPDGNDVIRDIDYDYHLNSQEKKKGYSKKQTKVIKKYQAIWVVGTDILLEYGQAEDVAYYGKSGNKTPKLDYFWRQTNNMSLVQRCMPHVDDINLNTVKLRNAVATLPPAPRMVIQQQLLDNVFLNGIKQKPEDLIQTLVERGYLVVNGVDDHGRPVYQNSKAIEFISTGLAEDVNLFNGLIQDSINRMRQVLGLPEGLDGTAGNPYTGKGQKELEASASSNALFPTLNKVPELFNSAYNDVIKKWQVYSKGKDLNVRYSPLGATTKQILALGNDFAESDVEVKVKLSVNQQQKQFLLGTLAEMSIEYKESGGKSGASRAEYMMLYSLIMTGRLKLAMFKIAQIEKRRERLAEMIKQQDQQFNIQSQQESAKVTARENRASITLEEQEKRKTAITVEAQKRKTAATTAYMKTFDMEGQPMPPEIYEQIMANADADIASAFADPVVNKNNQMDMMQGAQQQMPMQP